MEDAPIDTEARLEAERVSYKVFYTKVAALQGQLLLSQVVYYFDLQPIAIKLRNTAQEKFEAIGNTLESPGVETSIHTELQLLHSRYGACIVILENLLTHIQKYTK